MREWEHINEMFILTFKNSEKIERIYNRSVKSELLEMLEGTRQPLSPYLVNAILNDPRFYDDLIGGNDFYAFYWYR